MLAAFSSSSSLVEIFMHYSRKTTGFVTILWGFLLGRLVLGFSSLSTNPPFSPAPAPRSDLEFDKQKKELLYLLLCHHQEGGQ